MVIQTFIECWENGFGGKEIIIYLYELLGNGGDGRLLEVEEWIGGREADEGM